jgi:macrodomain Ter protein organizer (MatP/YcbG family)
MEAVIIEVENAADVKFWLNLAKKTGVRAKSIDTDYMEDSRLAELIEKGLKTKSVSRESVMKILDQKNEDSI